MTQWQQMLRDGDPGERMDADAAARIRELVVRAAQGSSSSTPVWRMRLALAAFACVVVMLSVFGTRLPLEPRAEAIGAVAGTERRQIQFATPGGTRIIWEINPEFTLGETIP